MKCTVNIPSLLVLMAATSLTLTNAILVQPYNYLLDDSALVNSHDSGSLNPFYNDQSGSSESNADKDIISIIGDGLARLKYARMLNSQQQDEAAQHQGHLSQEMAELIQNEQQSNKQDGSEPSLSSSVASMLMNVAQAAAQASTNDDSNHSNDGAQAQTGNHGEQPGMSSRGSIMELDTSSTGNSASIPSKSDLKSATSQWFNPKETIPVMKISSMGK